MAAGLVSSGWISDDKEDLTIGSLKFYYVQWDIEDKDKAFYVEVPSKNCTQADFSYPGEKDEYKASTSQ